MAFLLPGYGLAETEKRNEMDEVQTMDFVKDMKEKVHERYWKKQGNCANVMLLCLSELTGVKLEPQVLASVAGLHGTEKLGAQCGLALAGQLFMGIYFQRLEKDEDAIAAYCAQYAEVFRKKFSALGCSELRMNGYISNDPRHTCEQLTCDAVTVTYNFLKKEN